MKISLKDAAKRIANGSDEVTIDLDSERSVRVLVKVDEDAKPTDFECYSSGDITRFNNGDWAYVGLVVSLRDDRTSVEAEASVWAVERGFTDDESKHFLEKLAELVSEAALSLRHAAARSATTVDLVTMLVADAG